MDGPEENGKSRCTALPENGPTKGKRKKQRDCIARKWIDQRKMVKAEGLHCPKMDGPEENGKSRCTALPENGPTRGKW
jgi:hypothetical protein